DRGFRHQNVEVPHVIRANFGHSTTHRFGHLRYGDRSQRKLVHPYCQIDVRIRPGNRRHSDSAGRGRKPPMRERCRPLERKSNYAI
ncbi:unnamed protein product, partial [Nesidiocoris tenuis]